MKRIAMISCNRYRYCGHSHLAGKIQNKWQETGSVLNLFADHLSTGRRPDLIGGGLRRSTGGWKEIQALRKTGIYQKSDERILGDSNFVEIVLAKAQERRQQKYVLAAGRIGFEQLMQGVSALEAIPVQDLMGPDKTRAKVKARSLLCFWAVKALGMALTDLATRLGISVPTVSVAVQRGRQIAEREQLVISALLNINVKT